MADSQQKTAETKTPASLQEIQHGGRHYKDLAIQPAEYCQKNRFDFCESEAIKYLSRHGFKNGQEDVRKAIHFCQMILDMNYGVPTKVLYDEDASVVDLREQIESMDQDSYPFSFGYQDIRYKLDAQYDKKDVAEISRLHEVSPTQMMEPLVSMFAKTLPGVFEDLINDQLIPDADIKGRVTEEEIAKALLSGLRNYVDYLDSESDFLPTKSVSICCGDKEYKLKSRFNFDSDALDLSGGLATAECWRMYFDQFMKQMPEVLATMICDQLEIDKLPPPCEDYIANLFRPLTSQASAMQRASERDYEYNTQMVVEEHLCGGNGIVITRGSGEFGREIKGKLSRGCIESKSLRIQYGNYRFEDRGDGGLLMIHPENHGGCVGKVNLGMGTVEMTFPSGWQMPEIGVTLLCSYSYVVDGNDNEKSNAKTDE